MADSEFSQTAQLGKKIRSRRKELGMTQERLAEMLGVGHQALSRIEQGRMAPKMDRLPLLAKCLQCAVADLFRDNESAGDEYAIRIADLLTGLSPKRQEFVYQHVASLVFLLKLDE